MNKKKVLKLQIASAIFSIILGALLHFTFKWSNKNLIVAAFSAVNESTWEHLKILFIPMLISTIIGYFVIGKENDNYLCARVKGIISAMIFIVIAFYTYTGVIGTNIDIINIIIFAIAVLFGEYVTYKRLNKEKNCNKSMAIIILVILLLSLIIFTYYPIEIGLFKDPITGRFGIIK